MKNELCFKHGLTENGIPIYVMEMPWLKSIASGVRVCAGTADEVWPEEAGLAHGLEHMVFHGGGKFNNSCDLAGDIENIGGELNAWTWKDHTFYYNNVPCQYFERSVDNLSQLVYHANIPEHKIVSEMNNITQEINKYHDTPVLYAHELATELAYNGTVLAKQTIGTKEAVSNFCRNDFIRFRDRFYIPDNLSFFVVGGITLPEAIKTFDQFFSHNCSGSFNSRYINGIKPMPPSIKEHRKDIDQTNIYLVYRTLSEDSRYINMYAAMLDSGMSFPLFQDVREKMGLCYSINASTQKFQNYGSFMVYVGTGKESTNKAIDSICDVIWKYKNDSVLLDRTKTFLLGSLDLKYQSAMYILADTVEDLSLSGVPADYWEKVEDIKSITIDEVEYCVEKYLTQDKFKTVIIENE